MPEAASVVSKPVEERRRDRELRLGEGKEREQGRRRPATCFVCVTPSEAVVVPANK